MFPKKFSVYVCRVCLTTDSNNIIMDKASGWLELFDYCFGLQIGPYDKGKGLCLECAENLRKFTKFKQKCHESFSIWKSQNSKELEFQMNLRNITNDSLDENNATDSEEEKYSNASDELVEFEQEIEMLNESEQKTEHVLDNSEMKTELKITDSNENNDTNNTKLNQIQDYPNSSKDNEINLNNSTQSNNDAKERSICKCGKEFNFETNYKVHMRKCHTIKFNKKSRENNLEHCGLCKFSTQDIDVLCEHFDEHFKKNDLECRQCDYTGRDFAEMVYHRYTHMPETQELFCLACRIRFRNPLPLQFHFRSVHLKKKGGLCSHCGLQLSRIRSWKDHVKRKHTDVEDGDFFFCDCCGLKFLYRNEIIAHLRLRAGGDKCTCKDCGATFKRQTNLNYHINNLHAENSQLRIKCEICGKKYKATNLKTHIKTTHGEKFVCEICSCTFNKKETLQYHMLGHTKQRPYKCDQCDADYKTKSMLRLHKMKHTGLKPYKCDRCPKSFTTLALLRRHSSVHTQERAYKCNQCGKSFHYKKRVMEHIAKKHSVCTMNVEILDDASTLTGSFTYSMLPTKVLD